MADAAAMERHATRRFSDDVAARSGAEARFDCGLEVEEAMLL